MLALTWAIVAIATVGVSGESTLAEGKVIHSVQSRLDLLRWKPTARLEIGLLRLRGGDGWRASRASRKRDREPSWCQGASAGRDESAPLKRARVEGLLGSALNASYSLASMPFKFAYNICVGFLAAPQAAASYLLPNSAKHRLSETEILRFEGDEDKPAAIKRQITFYFSDSNLPFDSFLKGQIAKDSLGRVQLDVIAGFKRMRILGASVQDLAEAARSVDFLEVRQPAGCRPADHNSLLQHMTRALCCKHTCSVPPASQYMLNASKTDAQVSEDGRHVRRTTAVPDADVTMARTVYARPFQVD